MSNAELISGLETGSLDPTLFTHEAHLRLAWIQLELNTEDLAEKRVCELIQFYVAHLGAEDKFNLTLTMAAVKAVKHFKAKAKSHFFQDFIQEFPRLKTNFKDLLSQHYGFDIFENETARTAFLEPDILPFS